MRGIRLWISCGPSHNSAKALPWSRARETPISEGLAEAVLGTAFAWTSKVPQYIFCYRDRMAKDGHLFRYV